MKILLTKSEQESLMQHDSIESCTQKYIRYTPEFKNEVLCRYESGEQLATIFADIPIPHIMKTREYMRGTIKRWKKLRDTHGSNYVHRKQGNGGISLKQYHEFNTWYNSLSVERKLEYAEAENEILKTAPLVFRKPRLLELYKKLSQSGKNETSSRNAEKGASHLGF